MNRTVYEGRYLIHMVSAVVTQRNNIPSRMNMDWERLFHMADYHGISNIIYIAMLGQRENIPEEWGRRFYLRYQEALHYSEIYDHEELKLMQLFDEKKLPATVLESSATRRLYQIPEAGGSSPLRLLLDPDSYRLAKGFLIDVGYETEETFQDAGESLKGKEGFHVEIYYTLPFKTKDYQKAGRSLLERAYVDQTFHSIHTFSLESSFVYRIAEACYQYATDTLTIRKLLDTFLFFRQFREKMNMNFIEDRLQDFEIQDVAGSLIHVASAWFGSPADDVLPYDRDSITSYDAMESRILSNGVIGEVKLSEVKAIRDELKRQEDKITREKEREERKKHRFDFWHAFVRTLLWIFPGYKYMSSLYGILRYLPFLLPLFWIIRGIRMIFLPFLPKKKREQRPSEAPEAEDNASAAAASEQEPEDTGTGTRRRVSITPYDRRADDTETEKNRSGSAYATRTVLRSDAEDRNADRIGPGRRRSGDAFSDTYGGSAGNGNRYSNSSSGRYGTTSTSRYGSSGDASSGSRYSSAGRTGSGNRYGSTSRTRYQNGTTGTGPITELPKETKTTMAIRENGRQAFRKDIEASASEEFDENKMETGAQDENVKLWKFPTLEESEAQHPLKKEEEKPAVDENEVLGAHVKKWTFPTLEESEKKS